MDHKISNDDFARRRRIAREGLAECCADGCTKLLKPEDVSPEGLCVTCQGKLDEQRKIEAAEAEVRARRARLAAIREKGLTTLTRDELIELAQDENAVPNLERDLLDERLTDDQIRGAIEARRRLVADLRSAKARLREEDEAAVARARASGNVEDVSRRRALISEAFQRAASGEQVAIVTVDHQRAQLIFNELRTSLVEANADVRPAGATLHITIEASGGSIKVVSKSGGASALRSQLAGFRGTPIIDPDCELEGAEYDVVRSYVRDVATARRERSWPWQ